MELKAGGDVGETVESPGTLLSMGVGTEGECEDPEMPPVGMGVGDFVFLNRRFDSGPASTLLLTWFRYQPGYSWVARCSHFQSPSQNESSGYNSFIFWR